MLSVVLIVPAAVHAKAETLSLYMGWGSPAYTVPLSKTGAEPATHYGLHTWASETFSALLAGGMPSELAAAGYPEEDFAAVMDGLIASVRNDLTGHFPEVLEANGLQVIEAVGAA
ncbi:MAG: hypothetical protein RL268_196 [Pseudomonadota bacterium]|jgi:hypothetical protein